MKSFPPLSEISANKRFEIFQFTVTYFSFLAMKIFSTKNNSVTRCVAGIVQGKYLQHLLV